MPKTAGEAIHDLRVKNGDLHRQNDDLRREIKRLHWIVEQHRDYIRYLLPHVFPPVEYDSAGMIIEKGDSDDTRSQVGQGNPEAGGLVGEHDDHLRSL